MRGIDHTLARRPPRGLQCTPETAAEATVALLAEQGPDCPWGMAVEARGDCAELSRQPSAERLAKLLKRTGKPHVAVPGGMAAVAESDVRSWRIT